MVEPNRDITYFARTNHREPRRVFGIKQADRRSHMYIVGKTGTGKSILLKTMVLQDVRAGRGLALLDPHGDLTKEVLSGIPADSLAHIVHLDTPKGNWTFNPLCDVRAGQEALAVAELIEVFKKIWKSDERVRLSLRSEGAACRTITARRYDVSAKLHKQVINGS